jgi:DNA polymerase
VAVSADSNFSGWGFAESFQANKVGREQIMSKIKQLNDIKQKILDKDPSQELRKGATQLVFGDGNPHSEIVFIGEAPGKNEDLQGKPFVGAAGKFLEDMLKEIGMKRTDVYITNIVKYRPPNNRDPLPQEKRAFWPYLVSEINALQPKIIVTLGRHSMEYFLPNCRISQEHGKPKRVTLNGNKVVILPLFHPAAALYNNSMRQTLIEDFSKIPEIIKLTKNK